MIIKKEVALEDFEAWCGARYTMKTLRNLELETQRNIFKELENELKLNFDEWTEIELNDFLWFENNTISEMLGFDSWEQLKRIADGEDEEDEEED